MVTATADSQGKPAGIIHPDEWYTLAEAQARLGWGDWAMRSARRNGLRVTKIHNRSFVSGRDIIEYIDGAAG